MTLGSIQLDGASYLSWQRTSGSTALLPRTHSVPSTALSLSVTHVVVAPGTPYGDGHAPYSPGPASAGARLAASSPHALGDVPLLLSEQARLVANTPPAAAPAPAPRVSGSERRTRNASAAVAALAANEAALAAAAAAASAAAAAEHVRMPRNMSSFGADSKYGFDEANYSVFSPVTVECDMEFD